MTDYKYSTGLWTWTRLGDRFTLEGYRKGWDTLEAIEMAASIPKLSGLEFTYPDNLREDNAIAVSKAMDKHNLRLTSIYCNISSDPKWQRGAFTAGSGLKQEAIAQVKRVMDLTADLGGDRITFSLLQDGWDYSFQADYAAARDEIISGLRECCDYRKDVSIGVEYKGREPRVFCFVATAPGTLLLINAVSRPNIGVVLDVGHALMAGENMADAAVLLGSSGKLLHTHLNDNYRTWDDDLIVGSVHFIETLELVYWLRRVGYDGWYGLDIFPYREDPTRACAESIAFIETCHQIIDRIGFDRLGALIAEKDPTKTLRVIRETAFAG